ncbi:hypothetical protein T265_06356 [Opisthorchis viverrini]|uniref:Uncharacterized protein n=1 Tax=Opisthorchis viverrini TaxID=6198 RepID=A0A074ZKR5_OPIVI|nr:hypothetical protein T265_06356 [Opisthorchis viverrini]KER26372.1 hypothetical protein T265_06356 [Opisthorchis viverrini]
MRFGKRHFLLTNENMTQSRRVETEEDKLRIYSQSLAFRGRVQTLLESRRNIPASPEHKPMRRTIRRQVKKAKEMEEAQKAGNARRLFQLIRATGPRKPPVSESIKHQNGTTISNKEERLDRWAEYSEQQMSWPPAGTHLQPTGEVEPWTVNVEPPTASEVRLDERSRNRFFQLLDDGASQATKFRESRCNSTMTSTSRILSAPAGLQHMRRTLWLATVSTTQDRLVTDQAGSL